MKIFRFLTHEDHQLLLENARRVSYEKDEVIVSEGSKYQAIYVLEAGVVRVEREHLEKGVAFAHLSVGDVFGEMSFLENTGASASIVAEEWVEVAIVEGTDVFSLLTSVPGLAARFYQSLALTLSQRLRETTKMIPPLMVEEIPQVNRFHPERTGNLPQKQAIPLELQKDLEAFKRHLLELDEKLKNRSLTTEEAQTKVNHYADQLVEALNDSIEQHPALEKAIGDTVFRETFSLFMLSSLLNRSFAKPRGYSGDYYTIDLIYRREPKGDSRLGPLIDSWALTLPAAKAVQNRRSFLTQAIQDIQSNWTRAWAMPVTSLASGPAREIFDIFNSDSPPYLHVTCIDIDAEALSHTSEMAQDLGLSKSMNFVQDNLVHLAQGRGKTMLLPQQLIYSIGLVDYLEDVVAIQLLNWIYDNLLPGGVTIIGNFDVSNPNKAFMKHIVEWELIHRSPDKLKELFRRSKFGESEVTVQTENEGVNLFAFCTRPDSYSLV